MINGQPTVYGDVLAGGPIDGASFIKKPVVICRLISLIFSIVVFSTIVSGGWNASGICILNAKSSNCNFVTFVGITSMLCALAFLATDLIIPHISSIQSRKIIVLTDIGISCFYTLFWLISMGVIIGEWWKTTPATIYMIPNWQSTCIQAAASFSIFSLAIWVLIAYFAYRRFNYGKTDLFEMPAATNSADNKNFDGIPGGAEGTVSGGSNNPPMIDNIYQPYSISSQMNKDEPSAYNTMSSVRY